MQQKICFCLISFFWIYYDSGDNIDGKNISDSANNDVAGNKKRLADKDFITPMNKKINPNSETSCEQPNPSTIEEFGTKRDHLARRARPTNLNESALANRNIRGLDKVRRRLAFSPKVHKCT